MPVSVKVQSSKVSYEADFIRSKYSYESTTVVNQPDGQITVSLQKYLIKLTLPFVTTIIPCIFNLQSKFLF